MTDGRGALREQLAKALHNALSHNFEITWSEGYYPAADAILDLGMERAMVCDRKGRTSNNWPPQFERLVLSIYGPPVPVVDTAGETTPEEADHG